jgi:hypothetical protein
LLHDIHEDGTESEGQDDPKDCIKDSICCAPFVDGRKEDVGVGLEFVCYKPVPSSEEKYPEHDATPDVKDQVQNPQA